jgi:flavine halogenase
MSHVGVISSDIFAPTDPEMYEAVVARIRPDVISPSRPILTNEEVSQAVDPSDEAATLVLRRVNARKAIVEMHKGPLNLQAESVNGLVAHLELGYLGLTRPSWLK